jgi:hypothetical protein
MHINLLTGHVCLVPTFKTATVETAECNLVFRDMGLPNVLVSDRDTHFTSAFCTDLHKSLIFGSAPPQHHR